MAAECDSRIARVGVLYNQGVSTAAGMAEEIGDLLCALGCRAWTCDGRDVPGIRAHLDGTQLLVTLGGDGSILRAAQWAGPAHVLLFGVNLGRVGFLTETTPDRWRTDLPQLVDGNFWAEERMMVRAAIRRDGTVLCQGDALNDVVVSRSALLQVVRLEASIDGGHFTTYVGDGLIVATPTGSTAYALAAGGPILPPELRNIVLVPVAPHLSMERPVVLSEGVTVRVRLVAGSDAQAAFDGQLRCPLQVGDEVVVEASPYVCRFARLSERTYFYRTLLARLIPRDEDHV